MKPNAERITDFILSYKAYFLAFIAVVTLFFGFQLRKLHVYNELDIWYNRSEKIYRDYNNFKTEFGNDESILLFYHNDSLFTSSQLRFNHEITDSLEHIPGVSRVVSLSTIKMPVFTMFHQGLRPVLPMATNGPGYLKKKILQQSILVNNVVSEDGNTAAFLIYPDDHTDRGALLDRVKLVKDRIIAKGNPCYLFGLIPIKTELNRLANREAFKFLIISILIIFLVNLIYFRKMLPAVLPLALALLSVVWTLGLMSMLNVGVNVVTSIMPLILLVVSISNSIHFLVSYRQYPAEDRDNGNAVRWSVRKVIKGCFFSALTTAIAFLAFTFSNISPLTEFGWFCAFGVAMSFCLTFILLPIIFSRQRPGKPEVMTRSVFWEKLFDRLSGIAFSNGKIIVGITVFIAVMAVIGITRVTINTDQVSYFRSGDPVRVAHDTLDKWFAGIYPLELVFELKDSVGASPGVYYRQFYDFEARLRKIKTIISLQSPVVFAQSVIDANNRKLSAEQLFDRFGVSRDQNLSDRGLIKHYLSGNGKYVRITIKTRWLDDKQSLKLMSEVEDVIRNTFTGEPVRYYFSGLAPVFSSLSKRLATSQLRSISFSFVFIFIILLIIYRKLKTAIIGMIPNILPVITTIGIMGWLRIHLDVVTVLLASVSLGIAVDDTIHFINTFLQQKKLQVGRVAILSSFRQVGRSIILTTVLLIAGFIAMIFSGYLPIVYLGIFVSINVLLALLFDILLLPFLLRKIL